MTENTPKKNVGRPSNASRSNTVRSILFMFLLMCLAMFFIANMNNGGAEKTEVPISDVIKRANDPNGNIAKITVTGDNLEITLKGEESRLKLLEKMVPVRYTTRVW